MISTAWFNIGFEIELLHNRTRSELERSVVDIVGRPTYYAELSRMADVSWPWSVHGDGSLMFNGLRMNESSEISSGIMPYSQGLEILHNIFENMIKNEDATNSSCGLHINLSFTTKELNSAITPLRLVLFLKETEILEKFNRQGNAYCRPHRERLKLLDQAGDFRYNFGRRLKDVGENEINSSIDNEKYRTVNFGKLRRTNAYLEFRAMGGSDYHKKYHEICHYIKHFTEAMEYSISKEKDDFYYEKLNEIRNL